jgi:hypothetical protein
MTVSENITRAKNNVHYAAELHHINAVIALETNFLYESGDLSSPALDVTLK